jgi:hypothetical protein
MIARHSFHVKEDVAMKVRTRRQIIAALNSLRRDALSKQIHSKRDEITRDAQVSVLGALSGSGIGMCCGAKSTVERN